MDASEYVSLLEYLKSPRPRTLPDPGMPCVRIEVVDAQWEEQLTSDLLAVESWLNPMRKATRRAAMLCLLELLLRQGLNPQPDDLLASIGQIDYGSLEQTAPFLQHWASISGREPTTLARLWRGFWQARLMLVDGDATDFECPVGVGAGLQLHRHLGALLTSSNAQDVQSSVADALGRIGPDAREAVPALNHALADENPHVRRNAANALRRIENPYF